MIYYDTKRRFAMLETWKKKAKTWRRAALCYFIATVLVAIQEIPALFGVENTLLRIVGLAGYLAQAAGTLITVIELTKEG